MGCTGPACTPQARVSPAPARGVNPASAASIPDDTPWSALLGGERPGPRGVAVSWVGGASCVGGLGGLTSRTVSARTSANVLNEALSGTMSHATMPTVRRPGNIVARRGAVSAVDAVLGLNRRRSVNRNMVPTSHALRCAAVT